MFTTLYTPYNAKGTQMIFGDYIKERRIAKRITLRAFSEAVGYDPANYSRMERGVDPPPSHPNKLHAIARTLNIPIEGDEYREMERLADIGRGSIPRAILSNEQLAAKLPLFFRTLDREAMDGEAMGLTASSAPIIRHPRPLHRA